MLRWCKQKDYESEILAFNNSCAFLFVDAILSCDEKGCVCEHTFTENEFFFKGHFPEYPVVPGVILCETMAQAGGAALRYSGVVPGDRLFFFATLDKVKFRNQVRPGDKVRMEIEFLRNSPKMIKQPRKKHQRKKHHAPHPSRYRQKMRNQIFNTTRKMHLTTTILRDCPISLHYGG